MVDFFILSCLFDVILRFFKTNEGVELYNVAVVRFIYPVKPS